MKFKIFHKDYFNAEEGAFSRVTDREFKDSQITLTDVEAEIVDKYFKSEIFVGNVGGSQGAAAKEFLLYPDFRPIKLNLVYPKPHKTELRLYLAKGAGFKPEAGSIWFIYQNNSGRLVIGALPEQDWNNIGQEDDDDTLYQNRVEHELELSRNNIKNLNIDPNGKIATTNIAGRTVYRRDPQLAIVRFSIVEYACEIDPSHRTFIAERTKLQYMEAHHLIPMKFQKYFESPLDNLYNITSLCPNCHRAIHHAVLDHKIDIVKILYDKRPELQKFNIDYIVQFYNGIKVPKKP